MKLYEQYKALLEDTTVGVYHGDGRKAIVKKTGTGRHWVMMFRNGKRSPDEDYTSARNEEDAHDFARSEMQIPARKIHEDTIDESNEIRVKDGKTYVSAHAVLVRARAIAKANDSFKDKKKLILDVTHEHMKQARHDLIKQHGLNESEVEFIEERINMPQGHENTKDRISDEAKENRGQVKKMMGNRSPMELIARIIAKRIRE